MSELNSDDVKAVLDIATNSMDWGSGFLDREEVEILRRVGTQLGIDPIEVTPHEWRAQYPHPYRPTTSAQAFRGMNLQAAGYFKTGIEHCEYCPLGEADAIHGGSTPIA